MFRNILGGHFQDLRNPKGGLISVINVKQLENLLSDYIINHLKLESKTLEEEDLIEECKEIGLEVNNVPNLQTIKIGRIGHALSTYLSEKCFNLTLPVLPWAIPLALDQDLPNYDGICFDELQNLWILETKTSKKKETLSTLISQLISEITNKDITYFYQKARWYQRHYADRIKLIRILKPFKEFRDGNRDCINLIGFFIAPGTTQLIGRSFENNIDNIIKSFRRNVDFPNLIETVEKIYIRVEKNARD